MAELLSDYLPCACGRGVAREFYQGVQLANEVGMCLGVSLLPNASETGGPFGMLQIKSRAASRYFGFLRGLVAGFFVVGAFLAVGGVGLAA